MTKSLACLYALCKHLQMEFVLDEDRDFIVVTGSDGIKRVIEKSTGHIYDDRGDLFIALRNVVVQMVPNVYFRSADYIYGNKEDA